MKWTIDSWQNYPIKQVPTYNNGIELKNVEDELSETDTHGMAMEGKAYF